MRQQFPWVLPSLVIVIIFAFLFSLSEKRAGVRALPGKLNVVATISPIAIFTKNVAGDFAGVNLLVEPGADLHEFTLKPSGAAKLAQADVVIKNGGIDDFVDALVKENSKTKQIINLSSGIDTTRLGLGTLQLNSGSTEKTFARSANPHYWLDPAFAIKMVEEIRDGLIRADLKNAETYATNTERYLSTLLELDGEYRGGLRTVSAKKFVSLEPAFTYLAREYGLIESAVLTQDPEIAPSPTQLRKVISQMKREGIKVLLTSRGELPTYFQTVAQETGVKIIEIDTLHSIEPQADAYVARMRGNLELLKQAFK